MDNFFLIELKNLFPVIISRSTGSSVIGTQDLSGLLFLSLPQNLLGLSSHFQSASTPAGANTTLVGEHGTSRCSFCAVPTIHFTLTRKRCFRSMREKLSQVKRMKLFDTHQKRRGMLSSYSQKIPWIEPCSQQVQEP